MSVQDSKKLIRNSFFLYVRMIFVLVINLYATRLLLKYLGIEDFGLYNVVGSIVLFVGFLRQALTTATSRYLTFSIGKQDKKKLNEVYSMAINSHLILSIVLVFFLEIVGVYFLNNHLVIPSERIAAANWIFQFSIITFALSVIQTPFNSNIIAHERMDAYAFIGIAEILFKLIVVVSLAYCAFDRLVFYGSMLMVSAISIFLLYVYYCKKYIEDTHYTCYWDTKLMKEFVSYSSLTMLVNGADVGSQQCFSVFFNQILGLVANAALGIANQVNSGMLTFTTSLQQAYNPQIIKSYSSGNYNYFFKLIYASTKISFILQLLISIPVVFNIEYILNIWIGKYPDITPSLIRVIVLFYLIDAFQYPLLQAVHANGHIKTHQVVVSLIKLLVIPVFYIVLKITASASMAYLVWVVGGFLCSSFRIIYMKRLIGLDIWDYLNKVVLRIFLLAFIAVIITYYIGMRAGNGLERLLLTLISSCITIVVLSLLFVFDRTEKCYLSSIPVIGKLFVNK